MNKWCVARSQAAGNKRHPFSGSEQIEGSTGAGQLHAPITNKEETIRKTFGTSEARSWISATYNHHTNTPLRKDSNFTTTVLAEVTPVDW